MIRKQDKKSMKAEESQTGKHHTPSYNINFTSIHDCRRLLSVTLNQIRKDEIPHPKAKLLIYGALSLSTILEKADHEVEIEKLKVIATKLENKPASGRRY